MKQKMKAVVSFLLALACFSSCHVTPTESSSEKGNSNISETSTNLLDSSLEEEEAAVYEVLDSQDIPYYLNVRNKKVVMELGCDIVFQAPYAITSNVECNYTEELIINGNGYSMTFLELEGVYQGLTLNKPGAKIIINDLTICNQKRVSKGDRKIIYTSINATTVEYNNCTFDGPVRFLNNAKCTNCTFNNTNDTSNLDRYIIFFEPKDGNSYTMTLDGCTLSCPEGTYGLVKVYDEDRAGVNVHIKDTTFLENASSVADVYVDGNVCITTEGANIFSNNGTKALKASSEGVTLNGVAIEMGVTYTAEDIA